MAQTWVHFGGLKRDSLYEDILNALDKLPDDLREIFVRSHYEGRSVAQLAGEFGLPRQEVVNRLLRANRLFLRILKDN